MHHTTSNFSPLIYEDQESCNPTDVEGGGVLYSML